MKTKAKTRIPEIARNHVPSGIKPPTPAIGSQTATVMRDGIVFLHMTYTYRDHPALNKKIKLLLMTQNRITKSRINFTNADSSESFCAP